MNITLVENQESKALPLTKNDLSYLEQVDVKRSIFSIKWTSRGVTLTPNQVIGNIILPSGLRLLIKPKMPMGSVIKMLSYVEDSFQPLPSSSNYADDDDLFSLLARLFAEELERVFKNGLIQTHLPQVQVLSTVRGRILMKDSMQTLPYQRLVCSSFNLSADALENRIILASLQLLLQTRTGSAATLSKLQSMLLRFPASIQGRCTLQDLKKLNLGRHSEHYRHILHLSSLILRHVFFQQEIGRQSQPCFLVNMANLFEKYVARSLVEVASRLDLMIVSQGNLHVDLDHRVKCVPDLIVSSKSNRLMLTILDTKYKKSLERETVSNSDVYQLLSYMIASQCRDSWLIYPGNASTSSSQSSIIRIPFESQVFNIYQTIFNLELSPREAGLSLLSEVIEALSQSRAGSQSA